MLAESEVRKIAQEWIEAWNAHDLDRILSHYDDGVKLTSPAAAAILKDESGTVAGREALRTYFKRGLDAYPNLKFDLLDVLWGVSSIVLYYKNQKGTKTAEFMEIGGDGKVIRVVANYSA